MPDSPSDTPRPARSEPREVTELKRIRAEQPEVATAVDLQLALLDLQRRVRARVPLPWVEADPGWLRGQHELGRPLLRFSDIPLDWTDLRLMFRQITDTLRRFDAIEPADHAGIQALARSSHAFEPLVVSWFERAARRGDPAYVDRQPPPGAIPAGVSAEMLDQVLLLAMRPFLERCAEAVQLRADFSTWSRAYCPLCGGDPELAVITPAAERHLICSRCTGRWRFDALACPFCGNADRARITSFASRDGRYRVYACDACLRYLKAYDSRGAGRPVMMAVDTIAMLRLDAATMQKGYRG